MNRIVLSVLGGFVGLLFPLILLLWRAFFARKAWWVNWINAEFNRSGETYVVLGLVAVVALAVVGYLVGRRNDELEHESETVQDSNLELSFLAATDSLTGLFNGRSMQERLGIELDNAHRSPLSCLVIDIDHFKRINDKYGHPFGDEVLIRIAFVLKRSVRRVDAVGRLGGEEFLIILPDMASDRAALVGDRIREAVQSESFIFEKKTVRVAVSVGVADTTKTGIKDKDALLKAADEALYQAKKTGRNKTVIWESQK
ncbi:hypothetical protein BVX98_06595 [bacterium F11]|nr:hypothetical protein BVX98_06595 [bacterium F11]